MPVREKESFNSGARFSYSIRLSKDILIANAALISSCLDTFEMIYTTSSNTNEKSLPSSNILIRNISLRVGLISSGIITAMSSLFIIA